MHNQNGGEGVIPEACRTCRYKAFCNMGEEKEKKFKRICPYCGSEIREGIL